MRRKNGRTVSSRLASAFASLTLGLLLATPIVAQGAPDYAGAHKLNLANGHTFHATDNPVHGRRDLNIPGSETTVHVWQEEQTNGQMQSFYAVSRGGSEVRGRVRANSNEIRLRHFRFDPLAGGPPGLSVAMSARSKNRLHLVQLEAAPLPEMRQAIVDAGGKVLRFITDHTFIVEMAPQVRARVNQLDFVRWVGPYHAGFRVEEAVRNAIDGLSAPIGLERYSILLGERGVTQSAVADRIKALGGVVEMVEQGGWRVEATLTQDQLLEVAHLDEVQFIDGWGGPGEVDMNIVRQVGGGNYVEGVAGYTGQGVRGEVFDSELRTTHVEWPTAPLLHSAAAESCSSILHGTSSYSNNFAQGTDSDSRGMIPDGQGIFFCHAEATQFGGSTSRYTANAELIDPAGPYRAVFQTSSIGSNRTFNYTSLSAETDDYLFQHQILSTQSQSNAGNQDSRPQAWAKNIVSVGGFNHGSSADRCNDNWSGTGSIGPAQDGRIKPDLAFFYDSIRSAQGSNATAYTNFGGTSSATPQTSGHFGIFFQMWHNGVWAGHGGGADVFDSRPKMATAKAIMINSAHRYDWTNTGGCSFGDVDRFKQGWGTADLQRLYDRAPVTSVIDESDILLPLETKTYNVTVQAGETELNVTMAYTDPMGTVGAAEHRVNDLSLRVTAPGGGTSYWGNNGLTAGNWSTSGGSSNTRDTVENVFIQNPAAGIWTVEVIGDEIVQDSHVETGAIDADFALVVSGGLIGAGCTVNADCDDGAFCNGAETCNAGSCQAGTAVSCNDGVSCTNDVCNEGTDSCDFVVDDGNCDNGLFCDGAETCNATLGCQAAPAVNCDDGVSCTVDACNEGSDSCDNTPDNNACDNGLFCDGAEVCNVALGCQDSADPCSGAQTCNETSDVCEGGGACSHDVNFESGAGGWTNGADTCTTGAFVVGSPDATTWQVSGGNPGSAFYTQPNAGGLGLNDVDGGTCEALSPAIDCAGQASALVSLDYFHGQRDAGDDANDGFSIEVLNNGVVVDTLVSIGDVTNNPAWTNVSTTVANPGSIQLRVRATDAAGPGDIVEGGIDNVSVTASTPPSCAAQVDFSAGASGWTNSGSSTCTTGAFVVGTPDEVINGGVTTQVGGDHTSGSGNAFFSADNASSAGVNDIDGGNCIVTSPVYPVAVNSDVSVWYYHGQRDAGDDAAGDFFSLEISTNGGSTWSTLASNGDVTVNAAWTEATTTVSAGANVQFRVQAADGSAAGDLVEAGVDDITICASN